MFEFYIIFLVEEVSPISAGSVAYVYQSRDQDTGSLVMDDTWGHDVLEEEDEEEDADGDSDFGHSEDIQDQDQEDEDQNVQCNSIDLFELIYYITFLFLKYIYLYCNVFF